MGKSVMSILSDNLNRFIGPGKKFSSNEAAAQASGVGRSTIDRARKAEVALKIDNLSQLAKAIGVEPWELLHPDLDPRRRPIVDGEAVHWPLEGVDPEEYRLVPIDEQEEVASLARLKVSRHRQKADPPSKSPLGKKAAA